MQREVSKADEKLLELERPIALEISLLKKLSIARINRPRVFSLREGESGLDFTVAFLCGWLPNRPLSFFRVQPFSTTAILTAKTSLLLVLFSQSNRASRESPGLPRDLIHDHLFISSALKQFFCSPGAKSISLHLSASNGQSVSIRTKCYLSIGEFH